MAKLWNLQKALRWVNDNNPKPAQTFTTYKYEIVNHFRLPGVEVIDTHNAKGERTYALEVTSLGKCRLITNTTKRTRFLCVGGPHNLQKMTEEEAGEDYVVYNRANRYGFIRGKPTPEKAILVYFDPRIF